MSGTFDPRQVARRLMAARQEAATVPCALVSPPDAAAAYAVQDATTAEAGAIGGWKVGAKSCELEPGCAPLLAAGIMPSGASLVGPPWRMRGIEVEVGLRLGKDLVPSSAHIDPRSLHDAIDAVLPVIEVVETRLADWRESDPLSQMADLQSHGALIVGPPSSMAPSGLDLRCVQAYLAFDRQPVASTRGAHPAGDVWRLLAWLAWHCVQRGQPLRAGQIVTTGSCTGMLFASEGAQVQAHLDGIGMVELQF